MKKILFIAPLPPPVTGQAAASQKIIDGLKNHYDFDVINFAKETFKHGINSFGRIFEIFNIIQDVQRKKKKCDLVYLTLSQSFAGNIKDLVILFLTSRKKQVIHLHGGGIGKLIYEKSRFLKYLNKKILEKVDNIIVLGDSLKKIYDFIPLEKISVVTNSADNCFFLKEYEISKKYNSEKLNILFLSNLIPGKGYEELLEAVKIVERDYNINLSVSFAGGFASDVDKEFFLKNLEETKSAVYHGVVSGESKKELFKNSAVFCLASYYKYEGQPISIIEAYASGCFVLTTECGGIPDIFTDRINGILIEQKSAESIVEALLSINNMNKEELLRIGNHNSSSAKELYKDERYISDIKNIFDKVISK